MNKTNYYEIPVCYMANGLELKLPVHEIIGSEGPILGISASVHGDETIGVEIVRRVLEELKTKNIKGTVKIMPVSNPLAFEDASRNTPIDRMNMNRVFPGRYEGTITEIQAKKMADKFLDGLDAYIDVHAGGQDPVVDYVYIYNDEGFSRAFLSKVLYRPKQDYEGTTATYTKPKGILTVTIECGGGPNEESYIIKGVKGIINMLKYKGVIDEYPESREDQIVVTHIEHVNPHHGGLLVPYLKYEQMNTIVKGKITMAKIYNPMTLELIEEIKAPYEENLIILMRGSTNRVLAGDSTFMIGDINSAEV